MTCENSCVCQFQLKSVVLVRNSENHSALDIYNIDRRIVMKRDTRCNGCKQSSFCNGQSERNDLRINIECTAVSLTNTTQTLAFACTASTLLDDSSCRSLLRFSNCISPAGAIHQSRLSVWQGNKPEPSNKEEQLD